MANAPTSIERERRIRLVREALISEGWSGALEVALAAKLGCSARTVRRYRLEVEERIKARADWFDEQDDRTARSTLLDELRDIRRRAVKAGKFSAAVTAVGLEARLRGIDPGVKVEHRGEIGHAVKGTIELRAQRDVSHLPPHVLEALASGATAEAIAALVDTGGHRLLDGGQPVIDVEPVPADDLDDEAETA